MLELLILNGCTSPIEPPIEVNVEKIIGTWLNVDQNTNHITKIFITEVGNYLSIEEWGKCYPDDCDWEKRLVKKNEFIDGMIKLSWAYSDKEVFQEILLLDDPNGGLKAKTIYNYLNGLQVEHEDSFFKVSLN